MFRRRYWQKLVGAGGFEPPTSCSQSRRDTRLRYAPTVRRRGVYRSQALLFPICALIVFFAYDFLRRQVETKKQTDMIMIEMAEGQTANFRAGLVAVEKGYEGRRPHTTCHLTADGRGRFLKYLTLLEQVIRDASPATGPAGGDLSASFAPA